MNASIYVKKIEFHDSDETQFVFSGDDSYSLPTNTPCATVTFRIVEENDRTLQLTEVISGDVKSYDQITKIALKQLNERLSRLAGATAQLVQIGEKGQDN